jgi:RND family efflux transporter MFP subunit
MPTTTEATESNQKQHSHEGPEITPPPKLPPATPRRALLIIVLILIVLAIAGAASVLSRVFAARALVKETKADAVATVVVVHPIAEPADEELVLPASVQAFEESPIYARTNGYLLRWYKDIGSHVTKGEKLADIDTPEVDQELSQSRAARQQTVAQQDLAKISADRWETLRKTDSVSQQETDMQASAYQQAKANVAASDANVRRLQQLESFKHVYAPFSGVLIKRNVDPGALINSGTGGTELFILAKVDPLRVFTNVPQAYSPAIKVGMRANLSLSELGGQKFPGTVARTADAIDPATRTLLTEVDVPNHDGHLLRGSFGELHFSVKINARKITVPVNAMLFRQEGPRVAVVGADNKVQLRAISIGKDYGATLEILDGIGVDDRVIINPADSLEDGQTVNVGSDHSRSDNPQGKHS